MRAVNALFSHVGAGLTVFFSMFLPRLSLTFLGRFSSKGAIQVQSVFPKNILCFSERTWSCSIPDFSQQSGVDTTLFPLVFSRRTIPGMSSRTQDMRLSALVESLSLSLRDLSFFTRPSVTTSFTIVVLLATIAPVFLWIDELAGNHRPCPP